MTLEWAEATMGMFHLQLNVLAHIFKSHYGSETDRWSLSRMIKLLSYDANKFWNKTERLVKDFNRCFDFFNLVLDGCILAAVFRLCPIDIGSILQPERLIAAVTDLSHELSDYSAVSSMRCREGQDRDVGEENLLLFVQEGLMLRHLSLAIHQGDSGRVINALSYFTVWFQGTGAHNYGAETLRLTACLRKLWSPRLKTFWMENGCLVNISRKREAFVALDCLNEYIVREVKNMVANVVTPQTDHHLRNVLSLLVLIFWDIRKKMSEEMDIYISDYHSSKVEHRTESRLVRDYILCSRLMRRGGDRDSLPSARDLEVKDAFMSGLHELAKTQRIVNLQRSLWENCRDMIMDEIDNSHSPSDGE